MELPVQPPVQTTTPQPTSEPVQQAPAQQAPVQQPAQPIQQPPQTTQSSPVTPPQETPPSSPKSQKTLLIAIAFISLTAVFGAGIYLTRSGSPTYIKSSSKTQPPASQKLTPSIAPKTSALSAGNNDDQLDKDIESLTADLTKIQAQLGDVDQGMNDKPTDLTE